MRAKILEVCDVLLSLLSVKEDQPEEAISTTVRFLEILPGYRCRVRGPDGLAIYILKIRSQLCQTYLEPGIYLQANINNGASVMGEVDGVVITKLETTDIAELLVEGLWPEAFIEAEYISEKINELLQRNRVIDSQ